MYIDVIVPNFDDSADEVIISSWYKKVGDKISKGEVIADAESATVACGITSGYDCVLSRVIVKEGQTVQQGMKIAVIDTETLKDNPLVVAHEERQTIKEVLENISETVPEISSRSEKEEIHQIHHVDTRTNDVSENNSNVRLDNQSMSKGSENVRSFSEQAEEQFINILKDVETKAKAEAEQLKANILQEAENQANLQGSELKAKILQEYEEKASADASAMHQKIIQGSLAEAENTRSKLIEEARIEAQKEAETIRSAIILNAQNQAEKEADDLIRQEIENAKSSAKDQAEKEAKLILEKSIEEAKSEAKHIKKEILRSSGKYAKKEARQLIREKLNQAKQEAQQKMSEIIDIARQETKKEVLTIKSEVLEGASKEIKVVMDTLLSSVFQESKEEINKNLSSLNDSSKMLEEKLLEAQKEAEQKACEIIQKTRDEAISAAGQINEHMLSDTKEQMKSLMESMLSSIAADTAKEAIAIKDQILSEAQEQIRKTVSALVHTVVTEGVSEAKNLRSSMQKNDFIEEKCNSLNHNEVNQQTEDPNCKIDQKLDDQDIVKKLMNISESEGGSPEMYADNWNRPQFFYSPDDQRENIDFLRKRIAEKIKDTYDSSVISTVSNEVDMTAVLSLEKTFGKAFTEKYNTRLGFTPFFIIAAITALKRYRTFNAHVHEDEIIYKKNFDISVITCGNDGISAPVIRHADKLSLADIEKKMITLSRRAVEGTLSVEEVSGGTFTVVNAGIYGSLMGTDVLTPPQVATLSVHKMHNRPIATDEGVEIKPMLYVSLSYDHRIADTKVAAEFLSNIKEYVENPGWQLLGL
ncbi:MAG: hypothetical protein E7015_03815 [Alphaproteobacteria bacterium]|nr:hypothetical protein [Alphaproteobacteria bacterium]